MKPTRARALLALVTMALSACSPAQSTEDAGGDASPAMDARTGSDGSSSIDARPIESDVPSGPGFDASENDGAMRAMTSRDCVTSEPDGYAVRTRVEVTTPDGRCPDRVTVSATATGARVCGAITPCCDYFAECLFDVTFDQLHEGGPTCPSPRRRTLRGCRCLNNRVVCDDQRQLCPDALPEGYSCAAQPGTSAFASGSCSECGGDAGADSALRDASGEGG